MTSENQTPRQERLRSLTNKLLYTLHKAQGCCPACRNCRNTTIDAIMDFARHYAAVMRS